MDNLSAGNGSLPLDRETNLPAGCPASLSALQIDDSDNPSTDSGRPGKLDGFPPESLDDFNRNHWMA
jgi:hypothetical protein